MTASGDEGAALVRQSSEIATVRLVQTYLDEASLLADAHSAMAVVRAVSAFELFLRQAFLDPYLRKGLLRDQPAIADLVVASLLGDSRGWRERVPSVLLSCWNIDVRALPSWRSMGQAWRLRNQIVHEGAGCTQHEAEAHIATTRLLIETLLSARASAGRQPEGQPVASSAQLSGAAGD